MIYLFNKGWKFFKRLSIMLQTQQLITAKTWVRATETGFATFNFILKGLYLMVSPSLIFKALCLPTDSYPGPARLFWTTCWTPSSGFPPLRKNWALAVRNYTGGSRKGNRSQPASLSGKSAWSGLWSFWMQRSIRSLKSPTWWALTALLIFPPASRNILGIPRARPTRMGILLITVRLLKRSKSGDGLSRFSRRRRSPENAPRSPSARSGLFHS